MLLFTHTIRIAVLPILFFGSLLVCSCKNKKQVEHNPSKPANVNETIANLNRYLSDKDRAVIEGYARMHRLDLKLSTSGFFYTIIQKGKGVPVTNSSVVLIAATTGLIDGTVCYRTTKDRPESYAIGYSAEVPGLSLALPLLNEGGRAIFIFPPNLAYGLPGDGDKIPPRAVVVIDAEVVKVK